MKFFQQRFLIYVLFILITWILLYSNELLIAFAFAALAMVSLILEQLQKKENAGFKKKLERLTSFVLFCVTLLVMLMHLNDDFMKYQQDVSAFLMEGSTRFVSGFFRDTLADIPARIIHLILPK